MRRHIRRSLLWFLPLVVLPLGVLLFMQWEFLRALEEKSVSAERNWQRGALETVTMEVDERFRHEAKTALAFSQAKLLDRPSHGKHFFDHPVTGAKTFFAMQFHGGSYDSWYYDTNGQEKKTDDWSESEAVKMATVPWHVAHKWERVAEPVLQVDERDPRHRIILRPVLDESMHVVGVTGAILDEAAAKRAITAMAVEQFKRRFPKRMMSVRIFNELPRGSRRSLDFITQPFGFVFTNWRLAIRDACTSPEELAAANFRNNLMWTGGAFVVLLGAIGLAWGALLRQMHLSQMKSDFVSNVSHELRTPLSSIRVFGEYMRLGRVTKGEKIQEYGEYIEAESRRLTQLINNILDFSKIESAEKKYRFCPTDVVDLVEQTVAAFEMPLREAGVSITCKTAGARPPLLELDKDAIAQVIVNLLDNAVKYSGDRKDVQVTVTGARDDVRIAVRDHGIGIAASERKKIFEKFYRVGSGLVHDVKGSGLGLSIVEHVAKAHGGSVDVASEPGQGSTFTIVLPKRGAPAAVMTEEMA